jgi:hypothetical protein
LDKVNLWRAGGSSTPGLGGNLLSSATIFFGKVIPAFANTIAMKNSVDESTVKSLHHPSFHRLCIPSFL